MLVIVKENYDAISREAALIVADRLRRKPNLVRPARRLDLARV
jgi:hypothetical protein